MTLRLRLLLLLVGIVAAGLVISDVATYNALRSFLTTRVDQQLRGGGLSRGPGPPLVVRPRAPGCRHAPPAVEGRPGASRPFTLARRLSQRGRPPRARPGLRSWGAGPARHLRSAAQRQGPDVEAHLFFDYGGKAPTAPVIPAKLPGSGLPASADRYFTASGTGSRGRHLPGPGQAPGQRDRR